MDDPELDAFADCLDGLSEDEGCLDGLGEVEEGFVHVPPLVDVPSAGGAIGGPLDGGFQVPGMSR